jgi:hypothetical protein
MYARLPVSTWRFGLIHTRYCSSRCSALHCAILHTAHSSHSHSLTPLPWFLSLTLFSFCCILSILRGSGFGDFFLTLNETDTQIRRERERECVCVWLEYIARPFTHSLTQSRHLALPRRPKDTGIKARCYQKHAKLLHSCPTSHIHYYRIPNEREEDTGSSTEPIPLSLSRVANQSPATIILTFEIYTHNMSQYVDPYDTPKPMAPPPAYPGSSSSSNNGYSQPGPVPNVVVMQETNIDVTVVHHAHQQTKPQPTMHVTQVNQNNYNRAGGDDCGLGFCCGCCTALLLCSVM